MPVRINLPVAIALLAIAGPSSAQYDARYDMEISPPEGAYRASCSNIRLSGPSPRRMSVAVLLADCESWGETVHASLPMWWTCAGIRWVPGDGMGSSGNDTAHLRCDQSTELAALVPHGSFRQSCRNAGVDRGTLRAQCIDEQQNWYFVALPDVAACAGDVAFANGRLSCNAD